MGVKDVYQVQQRIPVRRGYRTTFRVNKIDRSGPRWLTFSADNIIGNVGISDIVEVYMDGGNQKIRRVGAGRNINRAPLYPMGI